MTQLTDTGLVVSRLDERLAQLTAAVRGIFGADLVLDADTVDGQTLGIYAEAVNNLDMLLEEIYTSLDPSGATGLRLSRLVRLNGLTRLAGTYSTAALTLAGQVGRLVPAGTLVHSTATLAVFQTDADATISPTGFVAVACTAQLLGAQAAPAGTLTAIDTPVFGLQSVTNAVDAAVGRDEETDGQLRVRRDASTAYPSQSVADGINAALANLPGVTLSRVYDNDQPVADPDTGQAKNSVYVVVQGGADADIAAALLLKKPAGIPTVGAVLTSATDAAGRAHPIRYSRPTAVPIYVTVNVSQRAGFPADGAPQITAAVVAHGATIGGEVIQSDFYADIAGVPNKSVTSIFIGTAPTPVSSANIAIAYDRLATFASARVVVNVT